MSRYKFKVLIDVTGNSFVDADSEKDATEKGKVGIQEMFRPVVASVNCLGWEKVGVVNHEGMTEIEGGAEDVSVQM